MNWNFSSQETTSNLSLNISNFKILNIYKKENNIAKSSDFKEIAQLSQQQSKEKLERLISHWHNASNINEIEKGNSVDDDGLQLTIN